MTPTNICTLYISGMHCAACEVLIEKKLSKVSGMKNVDVSLQKKSVDITYEAGKEPHIAELNKSFHELGYTFSKNPVGEGVISYSTLPQLIGIGILFIILYIIIEDTNLLAQFTLNDTSALPAFFALGVIASISSCAALSGGLLLSLTRQWSQLYGGKDESKRVYPVIMFNASRLLSFAILGGILGYIGSFFQISLSMTAIFVIGVSLIMLILGLQMMGISWAKRIRLSLPSFINRYMSDEQKFQGKYMPFAAGAMTFLLPCGFTLMAQTAALASGSFISGMLMMFIFAIGTLPMLWFIGYSSVSIQRNQSFAHLFNAVAAVLIVLFSFYNINAQLNVLGLPSMSDVFVQAGVNTDAELGVRLVGKGVGQYQQVTMEARGFEYFPKSLELQAGVPVKLTVKNNGVTGCAAAMYWPGIYNNMIMLQGAETKVEFTPAKPGNYKVSCTMGMVPPVQVKVTN